MDFKVGDRVVVSNCINQNCLNGLCGKISNIMPPPYHCKNHLIFIHFDSIIPQQMRGLPQTSREGDIGAFYEKELSYEETFSSSAFEAFMQG